MNVRYLPINIARPIIFAVGPILAYSNNLFIQMYIGVIIVVVSVIYALAESVFDLSSNYRISSYLATTFDIVGAMYFCYFFGMNLFIHGVFVYIISVCALSIHTRQAEYAVILTGGLHASVIALLITKRIPYINIIYPNESIDIFSVIFCFFVVNGVSFFCFKTIHSLVVKNNNLLNSLLPSTIIETINNGHEFKPKLYNNATVVFTDFCNFTSSTNNQHPSEIVDTLEKYFNEFDEIIDTFNLTRLKTIGDGYMFVSGVPIENGDSVINACKASIEILNKVMQIKKSNDRKFVFDIRIGISTGPTMAAVIGKKRISFDIWSSTVNLASRIESVTDINCISVCENTYLQSNSLINYDIKTLKSLKGLGEKAIYKINLTTAST